jgi:hypothetical protein
MGKLIHGKTFKMKLLLITLSILLTSSPLFGQETGVLYLWENGTKYMGEWKDGKKHGQGTYTNKVGEKYVGEYKDGRRWNGIMYDKYGKIEFKLVNGERIKQ